MGDCCSVNIENKNKPNDLYLTNIDPKELKVFKIKGKFKAKIVDVYDGDTFYACFYYKDEFIKIKCRSEGYDCPELRSNDVMIRKKANNSKLKFCELIDYGKKHVLVDLQSSNFDKYGRLLVTIFYNGKNVNDEMIKSGFAVKYNGGKK
jgi:micrococcal nuclease